MGYYLIDKEINQLELQEKELSTSNTEILELLKWKNGCNRQTHYQYFKFPYTVANL